MHSPVQALLWERWMRTRWVIAGASAASAMGLIMMRIGEGVSSLSTVGVLTLMLASLGLIAMLMLGMGEGGTLRLGFPRRLYRTPMRTRTAVASMMGYGMAVLAAYTVVLCFAFSLVFFWVTRPDEVATASDFMTVFTGLIKASALFALGVAVVFGVLQAWFWTVGGLNTVAAIVLAPLGAAVAGLILFPFLEASDSSPAWAVVGYTLGLIGPYGVAVAAVSFDRRGGWTRLQERLSRISLARARSSLFGSPVEAHAWYEYRRHAYLLPLLILVMVLFLQILPRELMSEFLYHRAPGRMGLLPSLFTTTPPIMALLAGLIRIALNKRARQSGIGTFHLARPAQTRSLAWACLRANLRATGMSLAILILGAVFFTATAYAMGDVESLSDLAFWHWGNEPYPAWAPPLAAVVFAALAMWTCYSQPLVVIGALLMVPALVVVADTLELMPFLRRGQALDLAVALFAVVIGGAGVWTLWMTRRRRAISRRATAGIAALMALLPLAGIGGVALVEARTLLPGGLATLFLVSGLALLPAFPLFLTPLLLHRRRHG
ncbi:MAG: hypothetical protein GY851_27470 [bacterium]|nr:hypothetical protein [bacterium]